MEKRVGLLRYAQNQGYTFSICQREQDLLEKQYLRVTKRIAEADTEYNEEVSDLLLKLPDSICYTKLSMKYEQTISVLNQLAYLFK